MSRRAEGSIGGESLKSLARLLLPASLADLAEERYPCLTILS